MYLSGGQWTAPRSHVKKKKHNYLLRAPTRIRSRTHICTHSPGLCGPVGQKSNFQCARMRWWEKDPLLGSTDREASSFSSFPFLSCLWLAASSRCFIWSKSNRLCAFQRVNNSMRQWKIDGFFFPLTVRESTRRCSDLHCLSKQEGCRFYCHYWCLSLWSLPVLPLFFADTPKTCMLSAKPHLWMVGSRECDCSCLVVSLGGLMFHCLDLFYTTAPKLHAKHVFSLDFQPKCFCPQSFTRSASIFKVPWLFDVFWWLCFAGKEQSINMIWWQNCPQFNVTWAVGPQHKALRLSLQKLQTVRWQIARRDRRDALICRLIVQRTAAECARGRFQSEIQTAQSRIPITSPGGEESILFSVDSCCQDHHRRGSRLFVRGSFFFDSSSCGDCAPTASVNGCRLCFCPFLHEAAVKQSWAVLPLVLV